MAQEWITIAAAQIPVLAVLLALGMTAKIRTVTHDSEPGGMSGLGPAVLVAERWRAPAMLGCAAGEAVLLGGLMLTGHSFFRWGAAAFFAVSAYVLWELRRRRPDAGCGCFGDVSAIPVGARSLARTVVLTAMAVGTVWVGPAPGWSVLAGISWIEGLAMACGLLLVAALSPEIEEAAARIRYRVPCEQRRMDPETALNRLRASTAWQAHMRFLASPDPVDSWRELCWRFFVYPGHDPGGNRLEVVFAVHLIGRRPAVRVALVDTEGRPVTVEPATAEESRREPVSARSQPRSRRMLTHARHAARHDSALYGSLASPLESRIEG
ncbi:MauE/DoxX family redox-associated membrane protein [Planobispora takensis]|uniref:MauE/DoxX family redox-associated membrane protein n=1 Tax=Planobispora takensis TaxID=1367882 RepID=UPI00194102B4|nr:MauE/DoxX family redox-associated membrane protein [Planobispora takensis]